MNSRRAATQRLLGLMGEHDFFIPSAAFNELVDALSVPADPPTPGKVEERVAAIEASLKAAGIPLYEASGSAK